jgi:hypothetical protein
VVVCGPGTGGGGPWRRLLACRRGQRTRGRRVRGGSRCAASFLTPAPYQHVDEDTKSDGYQNCSDEIHAFFISLLQASGVDTEEIARFQARTALALPSR